MISIIYGYLLLSLVLIWVMKDDIFYNDPNDKEMIIMDVVLFIFLLFTSPILLLLVILGIIE
ncbi:MAG: hypothetical protein ACOCRO_04770 [Halanaerobiales bacterium]